VLQININAFAIVIQIVIRDCVITLRPKKEGEKGKNDRMSEEMVNTCSESERKIIFAFKTACFYMNYIETLSRRSKQWPMKIISFLARAIGMSQCCVCDEMPLTADPGVVFFFNKIIFSLVDNNNSRCRALSLLERK
jgi:hypothetical protein